MSQLTDGLSETELDAARLGFLQLLRRKRFSPQFVENNGEELLARARFEYARQLADGAQVDNPTGWLINCAWRRAQNLLTSQGRAPDLVGIDAAAPLVDEAATPEERLLELDRVDQLQQAVDRLPIEERKVIELCYFEGMSVREVGRELHWDHAKADRRHHAALKHLRDLLGVEDLDSLAIELGLAAWVSLATEQSAGLHLPAGVESVADKAGHGIGDLLGRLHELARRLLAGGAGEPASTAATSSVARTAGVCGAAALACIATGVVGPGVGGVDLVGAGHSSTPPAHSRTRGAVTAPAPQPTASGQLGASSTTTALSSGKFSHPAASKHSGTRTQTSSSSQTAAQQAQQEFSPFATSGGGSAQPLSSAPAPASSRTTSSPSSSAAAKQANQEFGAFR